jgi:hypothetical protein
MKNGGPPQLRSGSGIREFLEGNPSDVSDIGRNQRKDARRYKGEKSCRKGNDSRNLLRLAHNNQKIFYPNLREKGNSFSFIRPVD